MQDESHPRCLFATNKTMATVRFEIKYADHPANHYDDAHLLHWLVSFGRDGMKMRDDEFEKQKKRNKILKIQMFLINLFTIK